MSMASAGYAEHAEKIRIKWVEELNKIINSTDREEEKVKKIKIVIEQIENFRFTE